MVVGRADEQRGEAGAQMAAAADVGSAEHWVADATNQPDVIGDVAFGRSEARNNGSQVGRIRRGAGLTAQQVVHGVEMVTYVADVGHRADEANVLRQGSESPMQLADPHPRHAGGDRAVGAANIGRRGGLQVPGIEMAGTAA